MEIKVTQEDLNAALAVVGRAVSTKNTIPELSGVLISTLADSLRVCATDLELAIETRVAAQVYRPGAVILPARYLSELIRKIPPGDILVTVDMNNQVATVRWGQSQFDIHGWPAENFPSLPDPQEQYTFTVRQVALRDMFRQTTFAVSREEARPWLTGVLFKLADEVLVTIATDGARIAYRELELNGGSDLQFSVIIPSRSLSDLTRLLSTDLGAQATISITAAHVFFDLGNIHVVSRLLEGQYPDVMRLVPAQYSTVVSINRYDFLDALDRAALLAHDGDVKIGFTSNRVTITGVTPQVGRIHEQVEATLVRGEALDVVFNSKFLVDFLKVVNTEEFLFECTGTRTPARLNTGADTNACYIVLPKVGY